MNEKFHRIIFIIIAIAIAATMFSLVSDYGSSTAEDEYQINNAIQLDRYYKSFGSDTSILENTRPMYSGWFNAITVTLSDVFAKFEIRSVRHTTNAIFGFVGILFAALLAKRCRNWRTASFTMLLLGLSPVIFGHSMFNLNDIPVFATFAASLFFVKRLADHFPKPKIVDAVFFALSSALCITANPDCSLIVAFALLLVVIGLVAQRKHNEIKKAAIRYPIFAVGSLAVIFGIVILLIPQGIGEWLNSFSPNSPTRILFEGKLVWTDLLPWYYNAKMLVMTIPAAVFVGMLLALGLCFVKKTNRAEIITLVCISAVSILIFSLKSDTNGIWQHLLYAEIPLYVVAAVGFDMLAESSRSKATQIVGI
ncbi:MAG: glycosyltransferase family 39 protein, partial [Bacteroidales bacterium]|nr:glycosyltransferase family 39 protein [Bacteroidales bacterium]